MKKNNRNPIILWLTLYSLFILIGCGESEVLQQIRNEIIEAERVNAELIQELKDSGYKVTQELERNLEAHAILLLSYFQDEGQVNLEMTGKLIEYMEYYRENSDYFNTDPSYQAYLPMIYGIQASLLKDDRTLATESTKQSLRIFEELLEDFPENPTLNIYYTIILGAVPKIFKTDKKAWEYHLKVDKMLVENNWERNVPQGLRRRLYRKAIDLSKEFEPESEWVDYFKKKLIALNKGEK